MTPQSKAKPDTQRAVRAVLAALAQRRSEPTFVGMADERPRIKGTTEELGEIIPPPARAEPRDDEDHEIHVDDGEEIGRRDQPRR
jgi:hypothetical protein